MKLREYSKAFAKQIKFEEPAMERAFREDSWLRNIVFVRIVFFISIMSHMMVAMIAEEIAAPDSRTVFGFPLALAFFAMVSGFVMFRDPENAERCEAGLRIHLYGGMIGWIWQIAEMSVASLPVINDAYMVLAISAGCSVCVWRRGAITFLLTSITAVFCLYTSHGTLTVAALPELARSVGICFAAITIGYYFNSFGRRFFANTVELGETSDQFETMYLEAHGACNAKSQFLAVVSHELRTPLNAVIGFSQMIHGEILGRNARERYTEYAKDIEDSAVHLLKIIEDLIDCSRFEVGKYKLKRGWESAKPIMSYLAGVGRENAQRGELAFKMHIDPVLDRCELNIDATRFKQGVLNLLSNAVKFTPEGGTVRLEAETLSGGGLRLQVCDTGVGMTAEQVKVATEPFRQVGDVKERSKEGLGIGLCLAKRTIEAHGGTIEVDSAPGHGTRITLTLPATAVSRNDASAMIAAA